MKTLPIVHGDGHVYRVRLDSIVEGLAVTQLPDGVWTVTQVKAGVGIKPPIDRLGDGTKKSARAWRTELLSLGIDWTRSAVDIYRDTNAVAKMRAIYLARGRFTGIRGKIKKVKAAEDAIAEASRS